MLVDRPEAALDPLDHQVANIGAVDAAGGANSGDRLAVAAVGGEGARTFSPCRSRSRTHPRQSEHQRVSGRATATRLPWRCSCLFPVTAFEQQAVVFITGKPASRLPP